MAERIAQRGVRWRTWLLAAAGASWPVLMWARRQAAKSGVQVKRGGQVKRGEGRVDLGRGHRTVRLQAKHVFFVPVVAQQFDAFAGALPPTSDHLADFAAAPEVFNMVRHCLEHGVVPEHRATEVWLHKGDRAMILSPRLFVYSLDMAQNFETYFAPLVPEMREGRQVLDFSVPGRLQTYAKSGLQFELASFPEEEDVMEEYFRWYRPQAGDTVFDIGAHCGVSTYHLAQSVGPQGRVVAFEPDPGNFELLRRNVERHGLRQVVPVQAAIASESGTLRFNAEGTIGSALVSLLHRESVGKTVSVEAFRLTEAFERWGVPAFCKIDIEGAEVDVLRDSAETLRRYPVQVVIDTNHPRPDGTMTDRDVENVLRGCGYEVASEARPLLTTWGRPPQQ